MIERMKSWGKAQWIAMAIGVVFFVALIDVLNDPKEPAASEKPTASASMESSEPTPVAEESAPATPVEESAPAAVEDPVSTGGVDYFVAAAACDNHLKFTLEGRKFKSHTVLGKRVVQLNPEDPAELWVSYDGEVDGANVIVLCAVGGTSDKPEVVKVDVTLP